MHAPPLRYRASISTLSGRIAGENAAAAGVCSAYHSLTNEDRKAVGRLFAFLPKVLRQIALSSCGCFGAAVYLVLTSAIGPEHPFAVRGE